MGSVEKVIVRFHLDRETTDEDAKYLEAAVLSAVQNVLRKAGYSVERCEIEDWRFVQR